MSRSLFRHLHGPLVSYEREQFDTVYLMFHLTVVSILIPLSYQSKRSDFAVSA